MCFFQSLSSQSGSLFTREPRPHLNRRPVGVLSPRAYSADLSPTKRRHEPRATQATAKRTTQRSRIRCGAQQLKSATREAGVMGNSCRARQTPSWFSWIPPADPQALLHRRRYWTVVVKGVGGRHVARFLASWSQVTGRVARAHRWERVALLKCDGHQVSCPNDTLSE